MTRPPIWTPTSEMTRNSKLFHFMQTLDCTDFAALQLLSRKHPQTFWEAAAEDIGFDWTRKPDEILDMTDGPAFPHFWRGAKTNLSYLAVDRHARRQPYKEAISFEGEDGTRRSLNYSELGQQVSHCASLLLKLGAKEGTRIGLFMPMIPETVIVFLACARIGAIVCPLFSGYGAAAIESRLSDCGATILATVDGFTRRGKWVDALAVARQAAAALPSLATLLVVQQGAGKIDPGKGEHSYQEGMAAIQEAAEPLLADASLPFMLIYTSGTTGKPKATVHSHAGFPFKAAQDMAHCFDTRPDERFLWYTDIGWMMGPWAICGVLIHGATLVLFDGVPDYPGPDRMWDVCSRHSVTTLGIAPTVIRSLMRHGDDLPARHDLGALRILGSSGEPWNPEPWNWFMHVVGAGRCPIINYSGGTEVSGGILGGNLLTPLAPCSFSGPVAGMDAAVFNDSGIPVVGEVGELVVRGPWPGMTHGFWQDTERYLETYWSRWPGIWQHGDWAEIDADGLWYIRGRSDDTIKVAGKRVGPAEVESVVVSHPAVAEAAAIGVPDALSGEALAVFAVLAQGHTDTMALRESIGDLVASQLGKPLRPHAVEIVPELPKTRNAKVLRRLIRSAYLGQEAGDVSSLENPQALLALRQLTHPAGDRTG